MVEVCPVKKYSISVKKLRGVGGRKSGSGMKDLTNVTFDFVPEGELYESYYFGYFGYFGMFEESPQLSTSGSARLLVTIQSNKLLLLAAM